MDPFSLLVITVVVIGVVVTGGGGLAALIKFIRKVDQGHALIINKFRKSDPIVSFTDGLVLPIVDRAEVMDISVKTITLAREGQEGLICKDNIRADIKVSFYVRVNKTVDDVLLVAQSIGVERASDQETIEELFVAKFSEALKTVGKQMEFEELYTQREVFKNRIVENIGNPQDLNGYRLDDAAIDYLEQTPLQSLDRDNILDARGIRKITEITTQQNMQTDQLRQEERKTITKQSVDADEAVFEMERRRADAEAKQQREIETVKAREAAETAKIQAEERTRARLAEIKEGEDTEVAEFNKQRQSQVADKDRERVVAIKTEQVEKDRQMEEISRLRQVELERINMQKDVEVEKKEIADVISTRIAVEKKVAEEEERIKDLRVHAEANRQASVKIIAAEAEAQEGLVKEIKAAEADEKVAEFNARKVLVEAQANLDASDKEAQANIRLAEGIQASEAASGLAKVKVEEAAAVAIEKKGSAEAKVDLMKMEAQAEGRDKLVSVREREGMTEAQIAEQQGKADAVALREKLLAEAQGETEMGRAKAVAVESKLLAEAKGLTEKLEAMKKMEGAAREHEEFRLNLDVHKEVAIEELEARVKIAAEQSKTMGEAFENADIRIMGGDGQFLDQFVRAASLGHAMDGFMEHSASGRNVVDAVAKRVGGGGSNGGGGDLKSILSALVESAEFADKGKALKLLETAKELGLLGGEESGGGDAPRAE